LEEIISLFVFVFSFTASFCHIETYRAKKFLIIKNSSGVSKLLNHYADPVTTHRFEKHPQKRHPRLLPAVLQRCRRVTSGSVVVGFLPAPLKLKRGELEAGMTRVLSLE
jgi:hypothetical protein